MNAETRTALTALRTIIKASPVGGKGTDGAFGTVFYGRTQERADKVRELAKAAGCEVDVARVRSSLGSKLAPKTLAYQFTIFGATVDQDAYLGGQIDMKTLRTRN